MSADKMTNRIVYRSQSPVWSGYDEIDDDDEEESFEDYQQRKRLAMNCNETPVRHDTALKHAIEDILSTLPVAKNSSSSKSLLPNIATADRPKFLIVEDLNSIDGLVPNRKIKSSTSPSICPVDISSEAWACVGFLPTISEHAEFDFDENPNCISSKSVIASLPKCASQVKLSTSEEVSTTKATASNPSKAEPQAPLSDRSSSKSVSSAISELPYLTGLRSSYVVYTGCLIVAIWTIRISVTWNRGSI